MAAAIDAQVQQFVRQLQHADDTILGGQSAELAAYLQAQLAHATAAATSPPASALPCHPESPSAIALASAFMTSDLKAASAAPEFNPTNKEQYASVVARVLPAIGQITVALPSSPSQGVEALDCDMPCAPPPHFDFSCFASVPTFDFSQLADALPRAERGIRGPGAKVADSNNAGRPRSTAQLLQRQPQRPGLLLERPSAADAGAVLHAADRHQQLHPPQCTVFSAPHLGPGLQADDRVKPRVFGTGATSSAGEVQARSFNSSVPTFGGSAAPDSKGIVLGSSNVFGGSRPPPASSMPGAAAASVTRRALKCVCDRCSLVACVFELN